MSESHANGRPTAEVEFRVGLVLEGGVSLAVYMGGVACEFLRAVKASRLGAGDLSYHPLLDALHGHLTIDVIAGTSAGGINGVFLARALATGGDLELGELWRSRADLSLLLDWQGEEPRSLMNGGWFLSEIESALRGAGSPEGSPLVDVLDLYVTATDMHGRFWRRTDANGHEILGRRHAKQFHLKLRRRFALAENAAPMGYEQNDFVGVGAGDQATLSRLAKLCRTTAALPGAFEPVAFTPAEAYPDDPGDQQSPVWLMDGGTLQKQPFAPVIKTIGHRAADRPVERLLFYVQPTPGFLKVPASPAKQPNVLQTLRANYELPHQQGIDQHLEAIEAHNAGVARLSRVTATLERSLQAAGDKAPSLSDPSYRAYLSLRYWQLGALWEEQMSKAPGFSSELRDWFSSGPVAAALEAGRLDQVARFLSRHDLAFEQRRLHYLIDQIGRAYRQEGRKSEWLAAMGQVEARLWHALELVRDAEWTLLQSPPENVTDWLAAVRLVAARVRWHTRRQVVRALTDAMRLAAAGPNLRQMWRRFAWRDMLLYPLAAGAVPGERDPIAWVRISPFEADTLLQEEPAVGIQPISLAEREEFGSRKLTGDGLGHCAGFLSAAWRRNDYLWGRLDAADIIITTLVNQAAASPRFTASQVSAIRSLAHECRVEAFRQILLAELHDDDLKRLCSQAAEPDRLPEPLRQAAAAALGGEVTGGGAPSDRETAAAAEPWSRALAADVLSRLGWPELRRFLLEEYYVDGRWQSLPSHLLAHDLADTAANITAMARALSSQLPTTVRAAVALIDGGVGALRWLVKRFARKPSLHG